MGAILLVPFTLVLAIGGDIGASDNPPEDKALTQQHKDLMPSLIEALKDTDEEVRMNVSEAIIALGQEAVAGLIEAVDGKDTELRVAAARLLGNMAVQGRYSAEEAIPALIKALKDQEKPVRQASAYALASILQHSQRRGPFGGVGRSRN